MRFIWTKHLNLRMKQREFSKKEIEETIINPDNKLSSFRKREIAQKNFKDKTLEVVFKKENDKIIIITAYWLKEV